MHNPEASVSINLVLIETVILEFKEREFRTDTEALLAHCEKVSVCKQCLKFRLMCNQTNILVYTDMRHCLIIIYFCLSSLCYGQSESAGVFDPGTDPCSSFEKLHRKHKTPIEYPYIREADVAWEKRIWREIDLREKQNHKYYYPLAWHPCVHSLFQSISQHILTKEIIAFKDEDFMIPLELSHVRQMLVKKDSVERYVVDEFGNEGTETVLVTDSESIFQRVLKIRLKEDWFFDKQRGEVNVRIIGVAFYEYIEEKVAYRELFWVYYPACRKFLSNTYAYNSRNDNEYRSFDELLMKRDFSSVVVKESNVYDRYINEHAKGIDALTESDDIKSDLFNWEHDLWNY